jgi:hypothetical protein
MNEIKKIDDNEYFSHYALSNSFLKAFSRAPAYAFTEREQTTRMQLGSLYHTVLLEPETFPDKFMVASELCLNRKNKPYPEESKQAESLGKELILHKDLEIISQIKNNLMNYMLYDNVSVYDLFESSEKEIGIFWEVEIAGQIIKKRAKLDLYSKEYQIISDLKLVNNCLAFERQIYSDLQYYRQAVWYIEGIKTITGKDARFIFLTFEDAAPYGIKAFELDSDYLEYADDVNFRSVLNYLDWVEKGSDKTQGYSQGIKFLNKPAFLK